MYEYMNHTGGKGQNVLFWVTVKVLKHMRTLKVIETHKYISHAMLLELLKLIELTQVSLTNLAASFSDHREFKLKFSDESKCAF